MDNKCIMKPYTKFSPTTHIIIYSFIYIIISFNVFASQLPIHQNQFVVTAGKTIEIPIKSNHPIAGDLTATGDFNSDDLQFIPSPNCHLSLNNCSLLVKAAPTSKKYTSIPITVSESTTTNQPVFLLSVRYKGDPTPANTTPSAIHLISTLSHNQTPTSNSNQLNTVIQYKAEPLQRSGNKLFYAIAERHPGNNLITQTNNSFNAYTNGPSYQIVKLTNKDQKQPLSIELTGEGADSFLIEHKSSYYGANKNCINLNNINSNDSCLLIIKGKIGSPNEAPKTALLTIRGAKNNISTFNLTVTTYVYAAGGFNTLGNAKVSVGDLIAECTAGTCSNALQGTGNNYATTNSSIGQWINALSITNNGTLLVGGVFGAIGGATSGASSGPAALLAQCTPGIVTGNSCINQINTGSSTNPYAYNNAYIDAIKQSSTNLYLGGDFSNIKTISVTTGKKILARCNYTGTSAAPGCSNYLSSTTNYANKTISAIDFFNTQLSVGGLFTQIAGYPTSAPSSGTTFASCSNSTCSQGMGSNNPNGSILGITNNGTNLYMGGTFTTIGGYTDSSGGYPLVSCTQGTTTTCTNALSGTNDANGYIEGITYSSGNLYVGGQFTTIGGATTVSGGKMLAVCTVGGTCQNFVTGSTNYASGNDWNGGIFAIAIGTQTTIIAN